MLLFSLINYNIEINKSTSSSLHMLPSDELYIQMKNPFQCIAFHNLESFFISANTQTHDKISRFGDIGFPTKSFGACFGEKNSSIFVRTNSTKVIGYSTLSTLKNISSLYSFMKPYAFFSVEPNGNSNETMKIHDTIALWRISDNFTEINITFTNDNSIAFNQSHIEIIPENGYNFTLFEDPELTKSVTNNPILFQEGDSDPICLFQDCSNINTSFVKHFVFFDDNSMKKSQYSVTLNSSFLLMINSDENPNLRMHFSFSSPFSSLPEYSAHMDDSGFFYDEFIPFIGFPTQPFTKDTIISQTIFVSNSDGILIVIFSILSCIALTLIIISNYFISHPLPKKMQNKVLSDSADNELEFDTNLPLTPLNL